MSHFSSSDGQSVRVQWNLQADIQVGTSSLAPIPGHYGLPSHQPERRVMGEPALRLYPGEDDPPPTPQSPGPLPGQQSLFAPPQPTQPTQPIEQKTTAQDYRTMRPVVPSPGTAPPDQTADDVWTLRRVFDAFQEKQRDRKSERTWQEYETLLRAWDSYHEGSGPDVRAITDESLTAFFEAQEQWGKRSWQKNRDYFCGCLKSVTVRSDKNRSGPRPGSQLLDVLPYLEIPDARWFRQRKRGKTQAKKIDVLTHQQFARVITATDMMQHPRVGRLLPSIYWRFLIGWLWTYGFRINDVLSLNWGSIDFEKMRLDWTESKGSNYYAVPLHPEIARLLLKIRERSEQTAPQDRILWSPPSYTSNAYKSFYPRWRTIWQWARVPLHNPHELRSVCLSVWKDHSPNWWRHVTGHSLHGDVQEQNYVRAGARSYREAVDTFPLPDGFADV